MFDKRRTAHRETATLAEQAQTVWLVVLSVAALGGAVARVAGATRADETVLWFLVVAGALVLLRDVKSIAWGDKKVEFERRLDEATQEARNAVEQAAATEAALVASVPSPSKALGAAPKSAVVSNERAVGRPGAMAQAPMVPEAIEDSDPHKGQFGGRPAVGGYTLSASVVPMNKDGSWCRVRLEVRADAGRPLQAATFHLHPTFGEPVKRVQAVDGVAVFNLLAWGAFTVGAVLEPGSQKLELDLAELSGIPSAFKNA